MKDKNLEIVKSCIKENIDITPYICYKDLGVVKALLKNNIDPINFSEDNLAEVLYYIMVTGDKDINSILNNCSKINYKNKYSKEYLQLFRIGISLEALDKIDLNIDQESLDFICNSYEIDNINLIPYLKLNLKHMDLLKLEGIAFALKNNINIDKYLYDYDGNQILLLARAIYCNIDITGIDKLNYSYEKMLLLIQLQNEDVDITRYNNDIFSRDVIYEIYKASLKGVDLFKYAEDGRTLEELKKIEEFISNGTENLRMKYIDEGYSLAVVDDIINSLINYGYESPNLLNFIDNKMSYNKVHEISKSLMLGLNIDILKDIKYDEKILLLLNRISTKINTSVIKNIINNYNTNEDIFNHLAENYIKINKYDLYSFSYEQIKSIIRAHYMLLNVDNITMDYSPQQIDMIADINSLGYDIQPIFNSNIPEYLMWIIIKYKNKGVDLTPYIPLGKTKENIIKIGELIKNNN